MCTVNIYLNFHGNCKEAFDFYKSVFGGEFPYVGTYADMPIQEDMPNIPCEMKDKIMHISLPISKETMLMGSDTGGEWAPPLQIGNNFSISINTNKKSEAIQLFNALAEGGEIIMPFGKVFWGGYYGMLTDKFDINWMVNCNPKK